MTDLGALLIRADASMEIGTGHVMRCLALAQAWQDGGGRVSFAMSIESPAPQARLQSEGMEIIHLPVRPGSTDDAVQTADLGRELNVNWIVADGYHFGAEYQQVIKDAGLPLLFVDDNGHARHYYADIVLNQNIHANEALYESREPYTWLLLGPRYVLLRREFWRWRGWERKIPRVARKVLVTLGGSDPENVTHRVVEALQQVEVDGLNAVVVVGGSNPHYQELQAAVRNPRYPICVRSNAKNMPELMAWADVAVSAGGSTCWELAFMGLPSLLLILADNQQAAVNKLSEVGVSLCLGKAIYSDAQSTALRLSTLMKDPTARSSMSEKGSHLVDGHGVRQVIESLVRA